MQKSRTLEQKSEQRIVNRLVRQSAGVERVYAVVNGVVEMRYVPNAK